MKEIFVFKIRGLGLRNDEQASLGRLYPVCPVGFEFSPTPDQPHAHLILWEGRVEGEGRSVSYSLGFLEAHVADLIYYCLRPFTSMPDNRMYTVEGYLYDRVNSIVVGYKKFYEIRLTVTCTNHYAGKMLFNGLVGRGPGVYTLLHKRQYILSLHHNVDDEDVTSETTATISMSEHSEPESDTDSQEEARLAEREAENKEYEESFAYVPEEPTSTPVPVAVEFSESQLFGFRNPRSVHFKESPLLRPDVPHKRSREQLEIETQMDM
jgi:hypothetical protein